LFAGHGKVLSWILVPLPGQSSTPSWLRRLIGSLQSGLCDSGASVVDSVTAVLIAHHDEDTGVIKENKNAGVLKGIATGN
jgi:hypothetical protein